jgi:hypothetical protein
MDTSISETKQGAATSADLLQQEPHVEVIEQKPSVLSSDEERLAAVISTIGLQDKRLSGAQRKRLTRERKKREGTGRKRSLHVQPLPPRIRVRWEAVGGVKRLHSDSSTTFHEKQQPKKPRNTQVQTGSYKEAVTGIKMAIFHRRHPEVKLEQTQVYTIQTKLLTAVDATLLGETPPQFTYSKFAQGLFWITCANEPSKV